MATKKISELQELETVNNNDLIPIVDVANSATKKATFGMLGAATSIPTGGIVGYDGDDIPGGYEETDGPIESGANTNGKYIKYNDGTMICWNTFTKSQIATTQAWGSLYWSDAITSPNFPVPFIDVPTVTMTPTGSTDSYWMINEGDVSITKPMNFRLVRATSRTGGSCIMNYIAIGKWK